MQRNITRGFQQGQRLFAFTSHLVPHLNCVVELPLPHIIQQHDINAGNLQDVVKLVIHVVNFYRNELGMLNLACVFDYLF